MISKDYELLPPYGREDRITIGRRKNGCGYIYIDAGLQKQLKMKERVYCYIHKKGSKLLLSFTEEPKFLGYRTINHPNPVISISGKLLVPYLQKSEKTCIPAHVEDGNIFVDLEKLRNDTN